MANATNDFLLCPMNYQKFQENFSRPKNWPYISSLEKVVCVLPIDSNLLRFGAYVFLNFSSIIQVYVWVTFWRLKIFCNKLKWSLNCYSCNKFFFVMQKVIRDTERVLSSRQVNWTLPFCTTNWGIASWYKMKFHAKSVQLMYNIWLWETISSSDDTAGRSTVRFDSCRFRYRFWQTHLAREPSFFHLF